MLDKEKMINRSLLSKFWSKQIHHLCECVFDECLRFCFAFAFCYLEFDSVEEKKRFLLFVPACHVWLFRYE